MVYGVTEASGFQRHNMSRVALIIGTVWLVVTARMGHELYRDYSKRTESAQALKMYQESLHAFGITEIQLLAAALILSRLLVPKSNKIIPSSGKEAPQVKATV